MKAETALNFVKFVHTLAWAFFVACIVLLPVAAHQGNFQLVAWLIGAVLFEIAILMLNKWACPLTAIAARYNSDRSANFDIFLPLWVAKYNKQIFGPLFVVGLIYAAVRGWLAMGWSVH